MRFSLVMVNETRAEKALIAGPAVIGVLEE
jgi:hypothetical protein